MGGCALGRYALGRCALCRCALACWRIGALNSIQYFFPGLKSGLQYEPSLWLFSRFK